MDGGWIVFGVAAAMQLAIAARVVVPLVRARRYGYAAPAGLALVLPIAGALLAREPTFWMIVGWAAGWVVALPMLGATAVMGMVMARRA